MSGFAQPSPSSPGRAAASGAGASDDFVAFLMAKSNTAVPGPAQTAPARVAGESRYAARVAAAPDAAAPTADCVIHKPFCLPDAGLAAKQPDIGLAVAMQLRDLLVKEKTFSAIRVTDEPGACGKRVTLEDGVVNAMISPGGFFSRASVGLNVTGTLRLESGNTVPATASFKQVAGRGGTAKSLLQAGIKATATQIGNQLVRATTGAKHLRSEISGMATATCVFGLLGLIPFVGLIMLAIAAHYRHHDARLQFRPHPEGRNDPARYRVRRRLDRRLVLFVRHLLLEAIAPATALATSNRPGSSPHPTAGRNMAMISVEVWDVTGSRRQPVELPDDAPVERLLVILVERLSMPRQGPDGQLISYKFQQRSTGKQLLDEHTLRQEGIQSGDVLRLQPEITAGRA